jgi:7-carboxy-7-deazaguanine synthase
MILQVSEIFKSIQGESSYAGLPCVFIRTVGCNLRCRYCDTRYAYDGGEQISVREILARVASYHCNLVEITGGEPLLQSHASDLATALMAKGATVLVETNGSQDISVLPQGTVRIMDIKCPSSGECASTRWLNVNQLGSRDEIKFVIADRDDYEWVKKILREKLAHTEAAILVSTVFGELSPKDLAQWMLEDNIRVRLQLQIHKYLWPPDARGV